MWKTKLLIAGVALGSGSLAFAQDYFDFGDIPGVPDQPAVQLDLDPALIGLASSTARAENPAAADLLSGIEGVRVRVYKSLEDVDAVTGFIDELAERLERDDWRRVVSVQDGSRIRIYIRGDDEFVTGVTAMIVDDSEAVFVNVAGSISAQQLAQSMSAMGGGELLASLGELDFGN